MEPGQREGQVVLVLSWQRLELRVPRVPLVPRELLVLTESAAPLALRARGEQEEFVVARLSCSGVLVAAVRCLPRVELHREDYPS